MFEHIFIAYMVGVLALGAFGCMASLSDDEEEG